MALIKCPECGREVSDKATSCPNCGYEINKSKGEQYPKPNKRWIIILICVFAVLACSVSAWWFLSSNGSSTAKETVTQTTISEEEEEPESVINIENLLSIKTIEWCGSNQQTPVLISENSDIVKTLKRLGFNVIKQETKTFEGEGGEPFNATITTLNRCGCSIETNGYDITITFGNVTEANRFISEAKKMGFKQSFEYEGRVVYNWVLKGYDGEDIVEDISISQESNKVSIYTIEP